jgi:XTP/dITP diphosphohydrolase
MTRFVLASANRHKLGEFEAILKPCRVELMPAGTSLPAEGTVSFLANAAAKARVLAERLRERAAAGDDGPVGQGEPGPVAIGDDSGLEVEALRWTPGIVSARYAGISGPGADRANYERLLRELAGLEGEHARRARFTCALAAVTDDLREFAVTAHWWGAIASAPRGEGGFGYDPVFVPEGSNLSVAEWPQARKDKASHRAQAGRALLALLRRKGVLDEGDQGTSRG